MEHNRKHKLLMIVALVLSIASLSIGFAAFSVSLNISSQASVTPNSDTFSVKFSTNQNSLVVDAVTPSSNPYSLVTTDGTIDNSTNPTIKGLSATFTSPGQCVEYTFYARNEGEYTAYLNNINFLGNKTCTGEIGTTDSLVQSACESINITATIGSTTYTETTPITGHTLAKKTGEQIKIKLEYLSSGTSVDGAFSITFPNVAFVYSTLDDSSIQPIISKVVKLESGNLNDPGSVVSIGDEKFHVIGQEDGNVKLLSMYNLHVGNTGNEDWNVAPLANPTGIQDEDARGFVENKYSWIGITEFSADGTYSGSVIEGYVNNYAAYLENLGVNISDARLITKEELEGLGCDSLNYTCIAAPSWVYTTTYWTGSLSEYNDVWFVNSVGRFCTSAPDFASDYGVRPVIEIPLSEF